MMTLSEARLMVTSLTEQAQVVHKRKNNRTSTVVVGLAELLRAMLHNEVDGITVEVDDRK